MSDDYRVTDPKVTDPAATDCPDEKPPVLGAWANLYAFILLYLAAVIFLFWLFTRHYAPVP